MSAFSVTVHHGPRYLLLVATGDARLGDALGLVDLAARIARIDGYRRVLADLISIHVLFSDEEYGQLQGEAVRRLAHLERLAYTVPACYQDGKSEPPALPEGAAVRTFTNLQRACDWMAA